MVFKVCEFLKEYDISFAEFSSLLKDFKREYQVKFFDMLKELEEAEIKKVRLNRDIVDIKRVENSNKYTEEQKEKFMQIIGSKSTNEYRISVAIEIQEKIELTIKKMIHAVIFFDEEAISKQEIIDFSFEYLINI